MPQLTQFNSIHQDHGLSTYSFTQQASMSSQNELEDNLINISIDESIDEPTTLTTRQFEKYKRENQHQIYMYIVYRAMVYVRKENERNIVDDGILAEELSEHIAMNTNPTSETQIGDLLLTNGYVLVAFSILMGRLHRSQMCFQYLMNLFDLLFNVNEHYEEFKYYESRQPSSFGIETEKSKRKKKQSRESLKRVPKHEKINIKAIESTTQSIPISL